MPGLDGHQLVERAVRQRPDLKVLFATGYSPDTAPSGGSSKTVSAMLHKPISFEQLARTVREVFDR
jgi:DNA-binding NarL/FixJ family response regulator